MGKRAHDTTVSVEVESDWLLTTGEWPMPVPETIAQAYRSTPVTDPITDHRSPQFNWALISKSNYSLILGLEYTQSGDVGQLFTGTRYATMVAHFSHSV